MAKVTLLDLKTRARKRADMTKSNRYTESELNSLINASAQGLYDLIIEAGLDYNLIDTPLTLISGQSRYDLPEDFYKIQGVDYRLANISYPMSPFVFAERNDYQNSREFTRFRVIPGNLNAIEFRPAPDGQTVTLWYYPTMPMLVNDGDTFNGFNGWDDFVVVDTARRMLVDEESDARHLVTELQVLSARITSMLKTNTYGTQDRISDVTGGLGNLDRYLIGGL